MINLIFTKKMRKILMVSGMLIAFSLTVMPALAEDVSSLNVVPTKISTADKIACVRTAVAIRESAIQAAFSAHAQAVQNAYATRANELSGAYSNSNVKAVQAGVKVSWADFKKSSKSAAAKWKTSRNSAWSTFRVAAKACKSPVGVSDSANSSFEVSGQ